MTKETTGDTQQQSINKQDAGPHTNHAKESTENWNGKERH